MIQYQQTIPYPYQQKKGATKMNEVLHIVRTNDEIPPPERRKRDRRGRAMTPVSKLIHTMPRNTNITFTNLDDFDKAENARASIRAKKGNKKNFQTSKSKLRIWRVA
jgi:hypothetical protein